MKYFKRELFLSDTSGSREKWGRACEAYEAEAQRLKTQERVSPELLYFLNRYKLHDETLTSYEFIAGKHHLHQVCMVFGDYRLEFKNVRKSRGWKQALEQIWLTFEIYPHAQHDFQLMVMMEESDCEIIAGQFVGSSIRTGKVLTEELLPNKNQKRRRKPKLY